MADRTSIGDRFKAHEDVWRLHLPRHMPLVIRCDGRAFSSLTRGLKKPFDYRFWAVMVTVAGELCKEIQGSKLAFVQSDEISVLSTDYDTIDTQPWFGRNLQKMVSVSASLASAIFTRNLRFFSEEESWLPDIPITFDARAFVLPICEVVNYFIFRQQDATRNSIQSLGQAHFSHKELHSLSCPMIQEKLWQERQVSWNDLPTRQKRGACVVKGEQGWVEDPETPIFTQDRSYIEGRLPSHEPQRAKVEGGVPG